MSKPKLKQLWPIIIFAIIFILGAAIRIPLLEVRDYWYDEAFTGVVIRQELPKMHEIIVNDVHPPMYYWWLKGWTLIAGTSPIALRLFSIFFGGFTIILAFIAARLWSEKKSWMLPTLTALIFAINPFFVNYSQEARMYTFLGFFILLASIFLFKARETKKLGYWIWYGISIAMILLTHYVGLFYVLGLFLWDFWQQYKKHPKIDKKNIVWFVKAYSIPFVVGLAWIPFFIKQASVHNTLGWVPNSPLSGFALSLHKFLFGSPVGVPGVPPALGYRVEWLSITNISFLLIIATTVLIAYLTLKKKWDKTLGFLGFMTVFPILLVWLLQAVSLQLYVERFLSGTAIFLLLFYVFALSKISNKSWLVGTVAGYAFLVVMIAPWQYKTTFPNIEEYLNQQIAGNTVVFTSPFDFTVGRFYLGEDRLENIKLYNVNNVQEDLSEWAIMSPSDQIYALPETNHLVVTPQPWDFSGYDEVARFEQFSVLKPKQ